MTIKDFFTNDNNPTLPKSEYLYNTRHIVVLVMAVVLCIILTMLFLKKSQKAKQILFYVFGGIFLFFEISSRLVNLIIENNMTITKFFEIMLPAHICSVMVWVFIVAIFSKKQVLINYSVIGGILATIAFLLYPAVGLNRVYLSFTCLYSTISHMLGFVCCVLLMTLGQVKFKMKDIWQMYLCLAIMFAWGALLNFVIFPGSDYMYMRNDPLELGLAFPYQILYVAILIVYVLAYYLIALIIDKIKAKKAKNNESNI